MRSRVLILFALLAFVAALGAGCGAGAGASTGSEDEPATVNPACGGDSLDAGQDKAPDARLSEPEAKRAMAAGKEFGEDPGLYATVVETIMQMAVYAGFPAALNGLFAAREVFASKA